MEPCIYTTQHLIWLEAARACHPSDPVCFRSGRKWSTARSLLDRHGKLPILIREQKDTSEELACTFIGELVAIVFPDEIGDAAAQLTWLDSHLGLQRKTIARLDRTERFPTWELQFKEWEIDNFLKAETWYTLRNLRVIERLPLPALQKLADGYALAANYIRGYALCHYPAGDIRVLADPVRPSPK